MMATPTSFTFEMDPQSDLPLWVQLRNRLAYLINTGYYRPGDQLPTVRALASDLSINYNTVNKAYLGLKSEGYLEATRGRGAFVLDPGSELEVDSMREVDAILQDCIASCRDLGLSLDEIKKFMDAKIRLLKHDEGQG